MEWNTVAGERLTVEEERQRIYAAQKVIEAVAKGNQQITQRVLQTLVEIARNGVLWMVYHHVNTMQAHEDGEDIERENLKTDKIVKESLQAIMRAH